MSYTYGPEDISVAATYATGTFTPTWITVNGNLTYTGTPVTGTWIRIGNLVHFSIYADLDNVTNFGTGQYRIELPFEPVRHYAMRDGGLHEGSNHYPVMGDAYPNDMYLRLKYTASNGKDQDFTSTSPHVLTTADFWYLSGTYEAESL